MARLCGRPGCSETGDVAYGMVPEDLLFWIAPPAEAPSPDAGVLCRRHADAMVVPLGWTLDDRREAMPRLFNTRSLTRPGARPAAPRRRRAITSDQPRPEQMQIDGTGEIARPEVDQPDPARADDPVDQIDPDPALADALDPWQPEFDEADDLDGLLQVDSPLLARAFRGTDRPKH